MWASEPRPSVCRQGAYSYAFGQPNDTKPTVAERVAAREVDAVESMPRSSAVTGQSGKAITTTTPLWLAIARRRESGNQARPRNCPN